MLNDTIYKDKWSRFEDAMIDVFIRYFLDCVPITYMLFCNHKAFRVQKDTVEFIKVRSSSDTSQVVLKSMMTNNKSAISNETGFKSSIVGNDNDLLISKKESLLLSRDT